MNASTGTSEAKERKIVLLLCLAAAVHVFVFGAAFPVFNELDEGCHFDLVVRYSQGQLPRGLEPMCEESSLYLLTYRSPEFMGRPEDLPGGHYPTPFWTQPGYSALQDAAAFRQAETSWQSLKKMPVWTNYEASQPPLYYALGGLWWRIQKWLGFDGLRLVYKLRFLNIWLVAALVWIGYYGARAVFPGQKFFTLGVPALIAFAPVQAFYSIENDVLSPIAFGIAFILLMRFWRTEVPGAWLGAATGLALAATFLTKLSNAPLLAVSGIFIALKIFHLARNRTLQHSLSALAVLLACVALPVAGWLAWMKIAFGDFTGSAAKLRFITWTPKPFHEWWHHPIFTPHGLWIFVSQLASSFWQGRLHWHDNLLTVPAVDAIFTIVTLSFLLFALLQLLLRPRQTTEFQRVALWFSFGCLAAGAMFLAWLSIIYDFGMCMDPSPEHPYLAEGRLILGALVPFLLLYLYGLNYLLRDIKNRWAKPVVLGTIILFMLITEIATDWTVFASQYNWYHLF